MKVTPASPRPDLLACLFALYFVCQCGRVSGSIESSSAMTVGGANDPMGARAGESLDKKCKDAGYSNLQPDDRSWASSGQKRPSHPCKSATVNARGQYSSDHVPCTISFHRVPESEGLTLRPNAMSDVCSDDNEMKGYDWEMYVSKWPDECVGDFARCYTLPRDERILLKFLCTHRDIEVPNGTTHVQVDCTHDKIKKHEKDPKEKPFFDIEPLLAHADLRHREQFAVMFAVVVAFLASGAIGLRYVHHQVIAPFQPCRMKQSKSDPDLSGKVL